MSSRQTSAKHKSIEKRITTKQHNNKTVEFV